MGGITNKFDELTLRNAKPGATAKRLADGGGLFLEVRPNGSKYWRMAYRYGGKQKLLALGVYPNVSISKARKSAQQAKEQLAEGVDPGLVKKWQRDKRDGQYLSSRCLRVVGEIQASVDKKAT